MTLPDLRGTANLDITPFRKGTRDALNALREVTDFAKKNGTLTLTTKLAGLNPASIRTQILAAATGATLAVNVRLNTTGLRAQLTALAPATPINVNVNVNAATLRAQLAAAAASANLPITLRIDAATLRAGINAALGGSPVNVPIVLSPASVTAAVAALRSALSSVVGLNLSAVTAVQTQIAGQITAMTALIAQLRALGSGGGGGGGGSGAGGISAGTRALLNDLEKLNNEYKRGDVNASQYAARLSGLQASLRTASGAAAAGTAEFKAIDAAITRTAQGLRNVESGKITQLRTELAGARQQFDAAAAAATNLAQKRAAIAAYEGDLVRIRTALNGMAASGNLTAQQLGNVNRLLAQTARESNTIRGGINVAGLSGNISNALQQLTGFVPGLAQVSGLFGNMPPAILGTVAALAAFTVGLASSFRTAAQFQQTMTDIKALTQPTAEGFDQLREAAMNIGQPLGVGARASAAAILELNRAGLTAADTVGGGLVGALNLAGAAGIDAAKASNLAAAAMTAFKLSASDMPAIADTFANFSNKTFLGAEDLSQAIAAVGPVARTAGLGLNEFSGYMATLAQGGFKAMSDAGTSLKTMLLSLQAPSETAAGTINDLGLNVYDAAGSMRPLADVLEELRGKLKGLTEQQRNQALKNIFGTDGIRAATILLGESRDAIQENIDAMGIQGEAARVARERLDTYSGAVAKLGASWETFKITAGEKLLPIMTGLVKAANGVVDGLNGVGNTMQTLRGYALALALAIGAIRANAIAAAAPALWAGFTAAVTGFFGAASTAAAAFIALNPFALAAVGVAGIAAYSNKILSETASIYDQIDKASNESHAALMKRVKELNDEGTELSRVQAQLLLTLDRLQAAQEGDVTGVDFWGNITRTVDNGKVQQLQQQLAALNAEQVQLRTEAERHKHVKTELGGPGLAPDQLKKREDALKSLRKTLEEKAFTLKVEGMTDLDAALAKTRDGFRKLREEAQKPFAGNLNNTALNGALGELAKQQAAEETAIRAQFRKDQAEQREKDAKEALSTAQESARAVQQAELEAMRDGQTKKTALREQELVDIRSEAKSKIAALAGFPKQQAQLESDTRRLIAAKRKGWGEEDRQLAIENGKRVLDAERAAADGQLAAMEDGRAKREIVRAREIEDLRASIAEKVRALAGDPEAQGRVQAAGDQQIAAKLREQNQQRVREELDVQAQVLAARKDARDAAVGLITDETQKRRAAREDEVDQVRQIVKERLKAAEGYPAQQQAILKASRDQSRALEQKWAGEDEADAKARAQRIADAYLKADDARISAERAGRENQAAQYELDLSRRLAAVKGNVEAEVQIEREAATTRARLAEQEAREQFSRDEVRLTRERDIALDNAKLSKEERENVWRTYYAGLGELSGKFQAGEKQRLQQQEAAELAAAERLRAARVQAALEPGEEGAKGIGQLQFEQGLTESLAQRLDLEQRIQVAQEGQAAFYADVLTRAEELKLTEVERKDIADKLESAGRAVLTSQKAQLDYQRQITGEAKQVVDLYGKLVTLTGTETGIAAAQRDYADATNDLGDAYARAVPYLQQFRDGSLKPDDFNAAKDALGGLITALEAQRQKLEQLRGEYARQRDALASVQDVLKGFGQEFGDEGLLNNAITFNQATYDQAKTALDTLLKGGKYDAAQLAEATKGLQSSYGGLKDSVLALGEARAKESEKEIARIKKESDIRLKVLDEQIAAAKTRGDNATVAVLERQRKQIVDQLEYTVNQLEARAKAARDAAAKSLTDRTGGLQQLLTGVQQGASRAGTQVLKLSADVKTAEDAVALSATRIRKSLEGAFTGLPALAGVAGKSAGTQFMAQLQKQLKTVKLPPVTVPASAGIPAGARAGSITNNTSFVITIDGKKVTGDVGPNFVQLLRGLESAAEAECRRRGM